MMWQGLKHKTNESRTTSNNVRLTSTPSFSSSAFRWKRHSFPRSMSHEARRKGVQKKNKGCLSYYYYCAISSSLAENISILYLIQPLFYAQVLFRIFVFIAFSGEQLVRKRAKKPNFIPSCTPSTEMSILLSTCRNGKQIWTVLCFQFSCEKSGCWRKKNLDRSLQIYFLTGVVSGKNNQLRLTRISLPGESICSKIMRVICWTMYQYDTVYIFEPTYFPLLLFISQFIVRCTSKHITGYFLRKTVRNIFPPLNF